MGATMPRLTTQLQAALPVLMTAVVLALVSAEPACSQDEACVDRPIKDKWAVVIGVSKFSNPSIPQLRYPAKDATDFCNFLVAKENFARDHVLLLTDEKATKVGLLEAFGDGWLPQRVMKDDLVVVYISTHGSPADRAGENFICAYDSDPDHPYATGIRLQDLSKELQVRTGCDRLVLLLDACHSGAAVIAEQKGIMRAPTNFNLDAITGSGQLIISSSRSDQSSWESKRYENGVFTAQLMGALQKRGVKTTLDEAFDHLKQGVETEVRFDRMADQSPIMLDKWKGSQLSLAAPPSQPRMVPPDLTPEPPRPLSNNRSIPRTSPASPVNQYPQPSTRAKPTVESASKTNSTNSQQPSSTTAALPSFMTSSWLDNQGDSTLERGTRLLDPKEVRGLSKDQATYLYNEAYARHGRGFSTPYIERHFRQQSWYRADPEYHWSPSDPRVKARHGMTDDNLVINEKRTPKQWHNMQLLHPLIR